MTVPAASVTSELSPSAARTEDPYMQGNFAPVDRELTLRDLRVRGALPSDLSGVLMRVGPNPAGPVSEKHHWFVGEGMLHAVEVRGGRALGYRNRFVRTPRVEQQLGLRAAPASPFAASLLPGNGSINVIEHAGRILTLSEVGLPWQIDRGVETIREYDFDGVLRTNMTGHPKIDPVTGELFFFGYDFGDVPLRYHVADKSGTLVRTVELKTKQPVMMHDFAVTETRAIFMDLPVVFDLALIEQGYTLPFRWDEHYGARIGVMRRDGDGKDLRWIEIPPCYVYHVWNAYDDGEKVILDVVEHASTQVNGGLGEVERVEESPAVRWEIDPAAGTVKRTVLDARGQEFPRIDPRKVAHKHRYGYAVQRPWAIGGSTALLKHDFERGTTEAHALPAGFGASEGVFVPAGPGEDEGYLVAPVHDLKRGLAEIHVIDAQRFTVKEVAAIEVGARIPYGFHGDFVRD